jgi:hypothetical protein
MTELVLISRSRSCRFVSLCPTELYSLLVNSFPDTLKDTKFMIDSKNQRIGEWTATAMQQGKWMLIQ